MHPKYLYKIHRRLRPVKSQYFLIVSIVFFLVAIYALRQNNFKMIELRQAVTTADEQNGDVETALRDLRKHVYGHMNTNLSSGKNAIKPPIQLKARYERLAAGESDRIKQQNAQVTVQGEAACAGQFPNGGYNAPRVACIQDYVRTHASTTSSVPDELYKFDFISPRWSPDLAGWSLVLGSLLLILFTARVVLGRFLKEAIR